MAGCSVRPVPERTLTVTQITRTTDQSGVADFGLVHPGQYSYQVSRSWDRGTLSGSGTLNVDTGQQGRYSRLSTPRKALEPVALRVRCDWPADLEKEGLVICAPFRFMPIEKDLTSWSLNFGLRGATRSVLCGPGSTAREIRSPAGLYLWARFDAAPALRGRSDK